MGHQNVQKCSGSAGGARANEKPRAWGSNGAGDVRAWEPEQIKCRLAGRGCKAPGDAGFGRFDGTVRTVIVSTVRMETRTSAAIRTVRTVRTVAILFFFLKKKRREPGTGIALPSHQHRGRKRELR